MDVYRIDDDSNGQAKLAEADKKSKKPLIIIAIIFFLTLLVAAIWIIFFRNNDEGTASSPATVEEVDLVDANQISIEKMVYGFADGLEAPGNIFTRDMTVNAQRQGIYDLAKLSEIPFNSFETNLMGFNVSKGYTFVKNNREIWFGLYDKTPELIYTHASASNSIKVVSVIVSQNARKIAFALENESSETASLWILDVKSKQAEQVADNIVGAPFLFSNDNSKIFLGPNVFGNSDGSSKVPQVFDIKNRTSNNLYDVDDPSLVQTYNTNQSNSHVAYVMPTVDKKKPASNYKGYYVGKPYFVYLIMNSNKQRTEVKVVNSDDAPNSIVFSQDNNKLYFAEKNILYQKDIVDGQLEQVFEDPDITVDTIYAASGNTCYFGSKQEDMSMSVYKLDIIMGRAEKIMDTNSSTTAIGFVFKD